MELRLLRYFLAVAEGKSVAHAAAALYNAQPALNRQLAQLEREMGCTLFARSKRKMTLIEKGTLLRRHTHEAVALTDITHAQHFSHCAPSSSTGKALPIPSSKPPLEEGAQNAKCGVFPHDDAKAEARAAFKAARRAMPADKRAAADARIAARVQQLPAWQQATCVLAYLSFGAEVETRRLIELAWAAGKTVALPRCMSNSHDMRWHRVESFEALEKSPLGVREPADDPTTLIDPATCDPARTIVLVPGLAFDEQGYRLGYGGGYYDVFLAQFAGTSIGLCRCTQHVASLRELNVIDVHDLPVDVVVTD